MASDAIYQEVLKVQQAGKPVVVSMGNLAASGGYYISGYCFVNPLTPPSPHSCLSMLAHPLQLLQSQVITTLERHSSVL